MDVTQSILSEITTYMKYAKFRPELNRRETWEELRYLALSKDRMYLSPKDTPILA